MSYDVYLEADLGAGMVSVAGLDANMTWNIGDMIEVADGKRLGEWSGKRARVVANRANAVANALDADPDRFDAMAPANGWGSRLGCIQFMREIAWRCALAPKAIFRVC